ncbi:hypothetical protein [Maricaulis sp. CAU 1757]
MLDMLVEMRRRNVFRMAGGYLVVGWVILQVASVVETAANLPVWVDGFTLVALITGFPLVLFATWAFELTPEGLRRTPTGGTARPPRGLHTADYALIAMLALVAALIGYQSLAPARAPVLATSGDTTAPSFPATSQVSIAVLPFADLSPQGDQQYFADGIAEELLNALAQFPDLKVAARTSAFAFRDADTDLRAVGDALGVAHVLEGSVRRAGDQLRITAQLIRAEDGFHLWSETYERELTDVFAIQDDIVRELSRVLQVRFGVGGGAGRAEQSEIDPRAYDQYLRGLAYWHGRDHGPRRRDAHQAFSLATDLAPDFADAWAALGTTLAATTPAAFGLEVAEASERGRTALQRALALNPDNARGHAGFTHYYTLLNPDPGQALPHADQAVQLAPNAAYAHYVRAQALSAVGEREAATDSYRRALLLDPENAVIRYQSGFHFAIHGPYRDARDAMQACCATDNWVARWVVYLGALSFGTTANIEEAYQQLIAEVEALGADLLPLALFHELMMEGPSEALQERVAGTTPDRAFVSVYALARMGDEAAALDMFETLASSDQQSVGPQFLYFHLSPGRLEFPESLRRHPRYHEIWDSTWLAALERERRARGHLAGLPLDEPVPPATAE